jgi:hypothetical protein
MGGRGGHVVYRRETDSKHSTPNSGGIVMKLEKKLISSSERIEAPDDHETLAGYVAYLESLIVEYGEDATITNEAGYDEGPYYTVHFEVLESDEQLALRQKRHDKAEERKMNPSEKALAKAKREAEKQEAKAKAIELQERKLLAKLLAKYPVSEE